MLYIIGAGAQAREAFEICRTLGRAHEVMAFVEQDSRRPGATLRDRPILDASEIPRLPAQASFVGAMGSPLRRAFIESVERQGRRFAALVDPHAAVGAGVGIGDGTIVAPGAVLTTDIHVARHVLVNVGAVVHHDVRVGAFSTLGPGCRLAGRVEVGEGAWVGMGACVLEGVHVGPGAFVGAGAVVNRDVPAHTLSYGVPARPVRAIGEKDWKELV